VRHQEEIVEIVVAFQHRPDSWKKFAAVSLADTLHMRPVEDRVVQNKASAGEERDTWDVLLLAVEEKLKRILLHALPIIASVVHAFVLTWKIYQ
jgi:hypothetical protein